MVDDPSTGEAGPLFRDADRFFSGTMKICFAHLHHKLNQHQMKPHLEVLMVLGAIWGKSSE
jgi:hypothetical protein